MLIRTGWRGDSVHMCVGMAMAGAPRGRVGWRCRQPEVGLSYGRTSPWCPLVTPPCPQAVIFPPLPVLLGTGCSAHLFVNLVLTILGWLPGEHHCRRDCAALGLAREQPPLCHASCALRAPSLPRTTRRRHLQASSTPSTSRWSCPAQRQRMSLRVGHHRSSPRNVHNHAPISNAR
jgi:hypothetical protein